MSAWESVLDQLASLDPAEFDPDDVATGELLELIRRARVGGTKLAALLTRLVAAAERKQAHRADGMVTMKSWLTGHCRMAGKEATDLVRDGRRLAELPELAAAFDAGAVSAAHVRVITEAMTPARVAKAAEGGIELAVTDRVLTEAACALGPEDTGRAVRRWVAAIDPDGLLDDAAGLPRVVRLAPTSGGRVYLSGHLDPVGGEIVHAALAAVMNGHRPAGDRRTIGERQGDALVELCRQTLAAGTLPEVRGERPQIKVHIDLVALCAERGAVGADTGELPFAGPIGPETARRIACDSSAIRIITGPGGLPLDVGQAQRTAPTAIRRAVVARDEHCVFAGCTAPAAWCDVHHVTHWAHGGPTSCENGALLCERHHTAVHEGGFSIARDPGTAVWHTYRPDGSEILIRGRAP
ncbi:MAG: DUF222 domain-containing protein [Blastococcus sp.]